MPSLIVERDGRFGARSRGKHRWIGTFDSRAEAEEAIERASHRRPRPSRARSGVVPPSEAQVLALSAEAAARGPVWLPGMILVAAYTGLRLFEVAQVTPGDLVAPVDGDGWRLLVRRGKGGYKDEMSVVFEPALGVLLDAARVRAADRQVFLTSHGTTVDRRLVARRFRLVAARVGYAGTFHQLRHFHAKWLLDQGQAIQDVAAQLRHHDRGELVQRRYGRHMQVSAALRRIELAG